MDTGITESLADRQLNAIADGFMQRIKSGVIPTVDFSRGDSRKMEQAAPIVTDKGLKMKVYANKKMGAGTIEDVTLFIEDYGQDAELRRLVKEKHGFLVGGIEVSMHRELKSDKVGEGKLIDPLGEFSGASTFTFTGVSPDVTQALMERIALKPS